MELLFKRKSFYRVRGELPSGISNQDVRFYNYKWPVNVIYYERVEEAPPSINVLMKSKKYLGFGRCVYCYENHAEEFLTDEHIIPLALNGSLVLKKAACESCRKVSNETYENQLLQGEFLVPRLLLGLNRRHKKKNKRLPKYSYDEAYFTELKGATVELGVDEFPTAFIILIPAEGPMLLDPVERKETTLSARMYGIGRFRWNEKGGGYYTKSDLRAFALSYVKAGYCYALAELGCDYFDGSEVRALLLGKRKDYYRFFGISDDQESSGDVDLHVLKLAEKRGFVVARVRLFSAIGLPWFDVVLGRKRI